MQSSRGHTVRRRITRLLVRSTLWAAAVVLVLSLAAWLAVHHVPGWYAPPVVDAAEHQRVRDHMEHIFNVMSTGLMGDRPFFLVLDQEQVNDWLVVGGELLPDLRAALTDVLEGPMIRFADGRITVAGMVRRSGIRTIAALDWELRFDPRSIRIRLHSLHAGALRVPLTLVNSALARIAGGAPAAAARSADWVEPFRATFHGLDVENRFFWRNGERWYRILTLEMRGSAIRLQIEPLG